MSRPADGTGGEAPAGDDGAAAGPTRRRLAAELRAERADVRRPVAELVELYRVGANV